MTNAPLWHAWMLCCALHDIAGAAFSPVSSR